MLSTCFLYILYSILYYTQLVDNKNFLEREEISVSNNSIISSLVECKKYKDKIAEGTFSNIWENAERILELDFEDVKNGLNSILIPKDKIKIIPVFN